MTAAGPRLGAWALAAVCGLGHAQADPTLRNWFDDPFFAVAASLPDCPLPLGPFLTEAERRAQSHHRAEKGTTCWLAGLCEKPNFYLYDRPIADAIRAALARRGPIADAALWVTVQGRVVYLEGCAADPALVSELEALIRSLPHVQQAIAIVRTGAAAARVPYRVRPKG